MSARHCLAIRHVAFEDLGCLAGLLERRGWTVTYCEMPAGGLEHLDPLAPDLLVVLGGPIGAYEGDLYPQLRAELALIERRLAAALPTLGLCLGAQLMAAALGARVHPGGAKEIGWAPVTLSAAGRASPLVALEAVGGMVLHWHGDTFALPAGADLLASSALYPHQAFAIGTHALGLQFHAELPPEAIEFWLVGHAAEIAATPGVTVTQLRADTLRLGAATAAAAERLFGTWLDHAFQRAG